MKIRHPIKLRNTTFARILVFLKFMVWDNFVMNRQITMKDCWILAGINTVMTKIPGR